MHEIPHGQAMELFGGVLREAFHRRVEIAERAGFPVDEDAGLRRLRQHPEFRFAFSKCVLRPFLGRDVRDRRQNTPVAFERNPPSRVQRRDQTARLRTELRVLIPDGLLPEQRGDHRVAVARRWPYGEFERRAPADLVARVAHLPLESLVDIDVPPFGHRRNRHGDRARVERHSEAIFGRLQRLLAANPVRDIAGGSDDDRTTRLLPERIPILPHGQCARTRSQPQQPGLVSTSSNRVEVAVKLAAKFRDHEIAQGDIQKVVHCVAERVGRGGADR